MAQYSRRATDALLVGIYLAANVCANLLVNAFGQAALVWTATALIPFDMTARDVLHQRWAGDRIALRMAALIVAGAALTALVNAGAWQIAVASTVAYCTSTLTDAVTYHKLRRHRFWRMAGSNTASACVDSVVFPLLAFASISIPLAAEQAVLKIAGGFAWTYLFLRMTR